MALADTIATVAAGPASATSDGQSAAAQPLPDMIQAAQFIGMVTAIRKRRRGIVFSKQIPAGPVSDQGGGQGPTCFNSPCGGC